MEIRRCDWAKDPLEIEYHDTVWGRPIYDDKELFERLALEGMQAGLSWLTILKRKEGMTEAFDGFDPYIIADYDGAKIEDLLQDTRIIRNKLKVNGLVASAKGYLEIQEELGSFSDYLWAFVEGEPIQNTYTDMMEMPAETDISKAMSKDLKKRGFKFVGPTICYAFMQSVGMVNDHLKSCFCYEVIKNGKTS